MQHRIGLLMLVCIALVIGSSQLISAQGDSAGEVQGFFFITGTEGTITEEEDGIYELTLEGVPEMVDWAVSTPEYFVGGYETSILVSEWAANTDEPLATTALLRLEDTTLRVIAGMPVYDPMSGELTLLVTEVEVFPLEDDPKAKGTGIPEEFEGATLMLVLDDAFSAGLVAGNEIMVAEGRVPRGNEAPRPGAPRPKRP